MKIDDILEEIETGKAAGLRGELLSPVPLQQAEEILMKIPPRKKFLGPRVWYKLLKNLEK